MKSFKEFLAEQEVQSVRTIIERDCKQFLKESGRNGFLLRGVKGLAQAKALSALDHQGQEIEFTEKAVRQDRKPLDFTRHRAEILDDWFYEEFGIRARSQCMFATGEQTEVKDIKFYGTPCVVFPIGDFKYVWSPHVEDLYASMNGSSPLPGANDKKSYVGDELEEKMRKWLKDKDYQTDGLAKAVTMKHEVMIKCDSYYAFPIEYMDDLKAALGFS